MTDCWPANPVYTLLFDSGGTFGRFDERDIHTSYLQRLGVRQRGFRALLPLFPRAVEHLPVQDYEVVISSSSAFAHGIRPGPGAVHVCYCHSPFRYVWHEREQALREMPAVARPLLDLLLRRIRRWDLEASRRVTHYIANAKITRERIARNWGRDATIIHPPVDVDRFSIGTPEDYLLVVTEHVRHKMVDVALAAARRAGRPVKVVGSGPDSDRLRALYGDYAEFVGRVSDAELTQLYTRALALVVPNVEDFGIAAVEAQAAGRPVVAMNEGGTTETVIDGETGVLVPPGDPDALAEALAETDFGRFDPQRIRNHAQQFSIAAFQRRFTAELERLTSVSAPTSGYITQPGPQK